MSARHRLKELRLAAKMSLHELGVAAGCTGEFIRLVELGDRDPGPELAIRIATALGCSAAALFPDLARRYAAFLSNG